MPSTTANSSTLASSKKRKTGQERLAFTSVDEYVIDQIISPDAYKFTIDNPMRINDLLDLQPTKKIPPKLIDLAWDMLKHSVSTTRATDLSEAECTAWIWAIVSAVINYLLDYSNLKPSNLSAIQGHIMSFKADVSEEEDKQVETRLLNGKTDISIFYQLRNSKHYFLPIEVKTKVAIDGAIQSLLFLVAMGLDGKMSSNDKVISY